MNKTALVILHVHFEDLDTLALLPGQRGYDVRYLDPAVEPLPAAQVSCATNWRW
nr:hypothetical protein [Telluria aromaticivorans]